MKIDMKSSVCILLSLLFSGHTIEGYGVQYDGGHESGSEFVQTRNTRYVDSASGRWNTNIGYSSTKEKEGGGLGGLLETVSSISSDVGSSAAGKGQGSDRVNAKGSFQIKVDADAAGARPTAILGGVLSKAASAIGSFSDLAKKNFESRRNFRGSFALEGTSYKGGNGHHFEDQDQIFGTDGHDAATSTKVVTVTSQSQISSNSEAVNGFKSEGRKTDSGFTERHLAGNVGVNGGFENGESTDTLKKEVTISSLPSVNTEATSTFRGSSSANFRSKFSGEGGSYSIHPEDYLKISETGREYFSGSEGNEETEAFRSHISAVGSPVTQFSRNLEYENESGNEHGHRRLFANGGSSALESSIKKDVGVTTQAHEGEANIQNLKTSSQTSAFKAYTSSNGNLHGNIHVDDYKDSDESIEVEDYSKISQEGVARKTGQHILANSHQDFKAAEETPGLRSQYSGITHSTDYESSSESEETDSPYFHETEGKSSESYLQTSGLNNEQRRSSEYGHNSGRYQNDVTRNTGQAESDQNMPHPTLLDFSPDSDYIESDESEEIEDYGSEVLRTASFTSQVNQDRPTIKFQKGVTGDYFHNQRQEDSFGSKKSQEKLPGSKIIQAEVSTSTHFNDDIEGENVNEYKTGHSSYLVQENTSQKVSSNGRSSYNNRNDDSSEIQKHGLSKVENESFSTAARKHSDDSGLVEKGEHKYTSEFAGSQALDGSFTSSTRESFSKPSTSEEEEENNHESGVIIISSNPQNVGPTSDFVLTDGKSENSYFQAGHVRGGGYDHKNTETTNREVILNNSEGHPRSSFILGDLSPEGRRRSIASSTGQNFESHGKVAGTILDNSQHSSLSEVHQFRPIAYPIVDERDHNSRTFSNYGQGTEHFHVIGGGSPVLPGTKIVRKEITETVHTSRGTPHEFEHRQIHGTPLRRNFNEGGFGPDSSDFLNANRQLHEIHHGHGHGHNRFEGRFLDRRSQTGFLGSFDSPHNIEEDVGGFGHQAYILEEIPHPHQFHQFHSAPLKYPGDGHERGRTGFRKIVKVTHEIEDVPRHGRDIEFGHGHYY